MWVRVNPNPLHRRVGDCVVRAISLATGRSWRDVYADLCRVGYRFSDMPSSNEVWGRYLYDMGLEPYDLPEACPECVTVRDFARLHPHGVYIIGTGNHAVAVIDGDYMDTFDSGDMVPAYFFEA